MYKCVIQMMSLFSNVNITMAACCSDSSIHSSASLKKYGLGRLGFSDLSLKDEQRLSLSELFTTEAAYSCGYLLALGRACVIKSSLL